MTREERTDAMREMGYEMRALRQLCGISKRSIAKRTGMSYRTVTLFEQGRRDIRLSNYLALLRELGYDIQLMPKRDTITE